MEDAGGKWRLEYANKVQAIALGVKVGEFDLGQVSGVVYFVEAMYLKQAWALLALEGAGAQHLLGPRYVMFDPPEWSSAGHPHPHLLRLNFAELVQAPVMFTVKEAVLLLHNHFSK